jgi:hypothetical protein
MLHRLPQFQILLPSCHLHFFLRPAIHAATHENLEAYRRPAKSLDAMRGLHAKIVLSSTTHTHRELTSSTLLQKHARLNLALRRSLVLDHRKLVHLAILSHCKDGRFSILFLSYIFFGCASTPLRFVIQPIARSTSEKTAYSRHFYLLSV